NLTERIILQGIIFMNNENPRKIAAQAIGYISISIFLIIFLLILNWFFKITSYQRLEGIPLIMANFTGPIGVVLGIVSIIIETNKVGKIGIACNLIIWILPYLYWFWGTLICGV
ncbi:hypothetical protein, partial [Clostridium botulinum]